MKLEIQDDEKIVLYLANYFFNSYLKEDLTKDIKEIFLKLIKKYNLKLGGVYDVNVFTNYKYGTILEIIKKEELLFHPDIIDIKVKILKNSNIYFKTKEYFILNKFKNVYYQDNYYYININDLDNLPQFQEFLEVIYNQKDNYLKKMLFIK